MGKSINLLKVTWQSDPRECAPTAALSIILSVMLSASPEWLGAL